MLSAKTFRNSASKVESDVQGGRGVRDGTGRDVVDAGLRDSSDASERDASGRLKRRASTDEGDGSFEIVCRHVVQQDYSHPDTQRLLELFQRVHFKLDFRHMAQPAAGTLDRRSDAATCRNVIVLDQNRVIESETMVKTAAAPNSVFLE